MKTKVYFRADGSSKIGLGHVIRSLALADILKDEYDCYFIIRKPLPSLRNQIQETCKTIVEVPDELDNLGEARYIARKFLTGDEIVVLDGYHFETPYQKIIKSNGSNLICIDDIHAYHFIADVVINHAGGISVVDYSAEPYTQFCFGLEYALLRKPFFEAAKRRLSIDKDKNVFICLGGADPKNDTLEIVKQCERIIPDHKCWIVIGGAYQFKTSLKDFLENSSFEAEILENLDAKHIVKYMQKCYLAITPPSTVAFEYLSLGGILFLKVIADNQKNINSYFLESGLAFDFNSQFYTLTNKQVNMALDKQKVIFDGNIQERYLSLFKRISQNDVCMPFS